MKLALTLSLLLAGCAGTGASDLFTPDEFHASYGEGSSASTGGIQRSGSPGYDTQSSADSESWAVGFTWDLTIPDAPKMDSELREAVRELVRATERMADDRQAPPPTQPQNPWFSPLLAAPAPSTGDGQEQGADVDVAGQGLRDQIITAIIGLIVAIATYLSRHKIPAVRTLVGTPRAGEGCGKETGPTQE